MGRRFLIVWMALTVVVIVAFQVDVWDPPPDSELTADTPAGRSGQRAGAATAWGVMVALLTLIPALLVAFAWHRWRVKRSPRRCLLCDAVSAAGDTYCAGCGSILPKW